MSETAPPRAAEPLIFEHSVSGRRGFVLPPLDVPAKPLTAWIPAEQLRTVPAALPEISERELVQHFMRLAECQGARYRPDPVPRPPVHPLVDVPGDEHLPLQPCVCMHRLEGEAARDLQLALNPFATFRGQEAHSAAQPGVAPVSLPQHR